MSRTKIQFPRLTAAGWTSLNPVLNVAEPGYETDSNKLKIGDGVTPWNDLAYITGSGGSSYTFENGLTESSGTVALGGDLTGDTTLTGTSFNFSFAALNSMSIETSNGSSPLLHLATNSDDWYLGFSGVNIRNESHFMTIDATHAGMEVNATSLDLNSTNAITLTSNGGDGVELISDTQITLSANNNSSPGEFYMNFNNGGSFDLVTPSSGEFHINNGGQITLATPTYGITLDYYGALVYDADYSADFGDRSIVDKGFVVNAINIASTSGGGVAWGDLTGTLSNQTDLQSALNAKQNSLGFTAENVANKSTSTALGTSDTLYPSQKAVKSYVDQKVYEASTSGSSGGSGDMLLGTAQTSTGKKTFSPDATYTGINIGSRSGAPSTLSNGDVYYDSFSDSPNMRIAGSTRELAFIGGANQANGVPFSNNILNGSLTFNSAFTFDNSTGTLSATRLAGKLGSTSVVGQVWTATDTVGSGTWATAGTSTGGGFDGTAGYAKFIVNSTSTTLPIVEMQNLDNSTGDTFFRLSVGGSKSIAFGMNKSDSNKLYLASTTNNNATLDSTLLMKINPANNGDWNIYLVPTFERGARFYSSGQGLYFYEMAEYTSDVSAYYSDRSLVDKGYVDSVAGGGGALPIFHVNSGNYASSSITISSANISLFGNKRIHYNYGSNTTLYFNTTDIPDGTTIIWNNQRSYSNYSTFLYFDTSNVILDGGYSFTDQLPYSLSTINGNTRNIFQLTMVFSEPDSKWYMSYA
jgi:hypothetical protein